jgi:hypothetical protein
MFTTSCPSPPSQPLRCSANNASITAADRTPATPAPSQRARPSSPTRSRGHDADKQRGLEGLSEDESELWQGTCTAAYSATMTPLAVASLYSPKSRNGPAYSGPI